MKEMEHKDVSRSRNYDRFGFSIGPNYNLSGTTRFGSVTAGSMVPILYLHLDGDLFCITAGTAFGILANVWGIYIFTNPSYPRISYSFWFSWIGRPIY